MIYSTELLGDTGVNSDNWTNWTNWTLKWWKIGWIQTYSDPIFHWRTYHDGEGRVQCLKFWVQQIFSCRAGALRLLRLMWVRATTPPSIRLLRCCVKVFSNVFNSHEIPPYSVSFRMLTSFTTPGLFARCNVRQESGPTLLSVDIGRKMSTWTSTATSLWTSWLPWEKKSLARPRALPESRSSMFQYYRWIFDVLRKLTNLHTCMIIMGNCLAWQVFVLNLSDPKALQTGCIVADIATR